MLRNAMGEIIYEERKMKIGRGMLCWGRAERITDRYGSITLISESCDPYGDWDEDDSIEFRGELEGLKGCLSAVVIEARKSPHCGDSARMILPSTPEVGERVILGSGTLFFEEEWYKIKGCYNLGLKPDDGREHDWMDPRALYRLHCQTVELHFDLAAGQGVSWHWDPDSGYVVPSFHSPEMLVPGDIPLTVKPDELS